MHRTPSLARWSLRLGALVLLAACQDRELVSTETEFSLPGEPGIYPAVSVATSRAGTVAEISLVQLPAAARLASYQGEITYDASSMKLETASFPEGIDGAAYETAPGRLRFVGTAGTLEASALLTLHFAPGARVTQGRVSVRLEELTAADLSDLTESVKNDVLLLRTVE